MNDRRCHKAFLVLPRAVDDVSFRVGSGAPAIPSPDLVSTATAQFGLLLPIQQVCEGSVYCAQPLKRPVLCASPGSGMFDEGGTLTNSTRYSSTYDMLMLSYRVASQSQLQVLSHGRRRCCCLCQILGLVWRLLRRL
jgi:hypothetical protein